MPQAELGRTQTSVANAAAAAERATARSKDHDLAKEALERRKQQVEIRASGGLSEHEINRMIDEAQRHQQNDAERRQLVELRNQAQGLVYSTERSITDYSELLSPLDIEELQRDVELLQESLGTDDLEELQLAFQNLEQSAYRISEIVYQNAASEAGE